ncbi:centromere protein L-like [Chrysoperla carnea]|uniref:centromere protein L-like n=1 Tax=Chrysoperla carnea TaxID=189513 RepID=UPI001D0888BD|nr:centromere protein L-like [Chrysoperla carnea]
MFQSTRSTSETSSQSSGNSQGFRIKRSSYTRKSLDDPESTESSDNENDFEPFLKKSWDIYSVSPLYRLDYSDIHLKRCSKWLREQIVNYVSEKKKDYEYLVQFSLIKSLKIGGNKNDYVKVEIQSKSADKTSILYEGILLATRERPPKLHPAFTYLPTLMARCSQDSANIVHGLLQKLFDCKICKSHLTTIDFKWLIAIFCTDLRVSKPVTISYTNRFKDEKNAINLEIPLDSSNKIWNRVRGENGENLTVTAEEVLEFHSLFNKIIEKYFEINVERLHFTKIKMYNFTVSYPFKIQINDSRLLKELLLFQGEDSIIFY